MNLELGRAWSILMQTKAYLVYRAAIYGALAVGALLYLAFLGIIGAIFGGGAALIVFVITLVGGGVMGLGRLLGDYVLYMLKAGHVALITEIIEKGALPAGVSQTAWAKERVLGLVKEASVLSLLDQLVKGIIRYINREILGFSQILPIPGLEGAANAAGKIVQLSLTYVDETMLAYALRTHAANVFESSKRGIVLYCQCWKGLLKNAVALAVAGYVLTALLFAVFAVPLGAVALLVPAKWATFRMGLFLTALVLAGSIKLVLYDPFACTATILTFFTESKGLEPSPEWESRLDAASELFRELKTKAAGFAEDLARQAAPPTTQPPSATAA